MAVYTILVYVACGLTENRMWIQFACLTGATLLMVELNNRNALIRVYSRMVSCSFLALSGMACFLFPSVQAALVQLCFCAFYVLLFRAYQDKKATGWIFYAFLCIGIISTIFVQILYYVPVFWILMIFNVLSFSSKTFWASILGLITPYWFLGGYYLYDQNLDGFIAHWVELGQFQPLFDYSHVTVQQAVTFFFFVILAFTGSVHFLRNSFNDKIRTRMLYEVFITVDACSIVFIVLQPQHYHSLLPVIIASTAPLTGHYIALTRTLITNISFYVIALATLAITAFNLWTPSLTF